MAYGFLRCRRATETTGLLDRNKITIRRRNRANEASGKGTWYRSRLERPRSVRDTFLQLFCFSPVRLSKTMFAPLVIPEKVRRTAESQGEAGHVWLVNLPQHIVDIERR
jgi:hypothetical protein